MYTLKYPDGSTERYKDRFVVKGFTEMYNVYLEAFALVVKLKSVLSYFAFCRKSILAPPLVDKCEDFASS